MSIIYYFKPAMRQIKINIADAGANRNPSERETNAFT